MTTIKDIIWLAGLLEGEGCFDFIRCPRITINMTDLDIIERVRKIYKTNNKITIIGRGHYKTAYYLNISGDLSIQWMMTIYVLMGIRRQAQIREVIIKWKEMSGHVTEKTRRQADKASAKASLIKNMMRLKNISREEARKLIEID